jgi:phosphatidylserine/phosphatidylglycerophosphate/cardiolipin synthase-like enzyme
MAVVRERPLRRPAIIAPGRNAWRGLAALDAGVLVDAADYYRAFAESARHARHRVLMAGWQFDSGVPLLRGADAPADEDVRFLPFLTSLCDANPDLEIFILAWDFHPVFMLEREWTQRLLFQWTAHPRLHFLFEEAPVPGGSHHQKFVVVDDTHAFLGGMDVCEARWDDRAHCGTNELRTSRGSPQKPYHDVQAWLAGPEIPAALAGLFWERWRGAGGDPPPAVTGEAAGTKAIAPRPRGLLPLGPSRVALSRTLPAADRPGVREVERLFADAIVAAERLLYVETQYFSSRRITDALIARMERPDRPRLEIVVIVNERAEALKEEIAVGLRQAANLERLRAVAAATGHALAFHYPICDRPNDAFRATYVHSKVLVVDDRFLTVGSANLTNRSMGIDSEIHVSWETTGGDAAAGRLARGIRRVRVSLLAEHAGVRGVAAVRALARVDGLVDRLRALAAHPGARLGVHGPPSAAQAAALALLDPDELPFDPDTAADARPDARRGDDEPTEESGEGARPVVEAMSSVWATLAELPARLLGGQGRNAG